MLSRSRPATKYVRREFRNFTVAAWLIQFRRVNTVRPRLAPIYIYDLWLARCYSLQCRVVCRRAICTVQGGTSSSVHKRCESLGQRCVVISALSLSEVGVIRNCMHESDYNSDTLCHKGLRYRTMSSEDIKRWWDPVYLKFSFTNCNETFARSRRHCKIWGSHGGILDRSGLLGCNAVSLG
jgi:hypothetical protein